MENENVHLPPYFTDWICRHLDSDAEILTVTQLKGSTSSDLFRIEVSEGTSDFNLVLRLLTNREWLAEEPDLAAHEAAALELARKSNLPVPEIVAFDAEGHNYGIPAVLMTEVPGEVNLQPVNFDGWLRQMAAALQPLHTLDAADFHWTYHPYNDPKTLQVPCWTSQPKLWKTAIEVVNQPAPPSEMCFIHRDYHPMNTLWQGKTLSGIVDWVNACRGPAPFDLAWNRLNLVQMYGLEVADHLRQHAVNLCGKEVWHPYWDLMALIEVLPGPPEVYPPWLDFGLRGFSTPLMIKRIEDYLSGMLNELAAS